MNIDSMFSNVRSSQTIEIIADKYNSYEIARQDFLLTLQEIKLLLYVAFIKNYKKLRRWGICSNCSWSLSVKQGNMYLDLNLIIVNFILPF